MKNKEYVSIIDEISILNAFIEVFRGYTRADEPDMRALETVLYKIECEYCSVLEKLTAIKDNS